MLFETYVTKNSYGWNQLRWFYRLLAEDPITEAEIGAEEGQSQYNLEELFEVKLWLAEHTDGESTDDSEVVCGCRQLSEGKRAVGGVETTDKSPPPERNKTVVQSQTSIRYPRSFSPYATGQNWPKGTHGRYQRPSQLLLRYLGTRREVEIPGKQSNTVIGMKMTRRWWLLPSL